ncbi:hypothetical protein Scep_009249 [Stephania cephalantha]|uniref:Uncharacterized protein n=1 Tax=Stephania cephalantha TaxID=152367 RepID=A0AAP0PCD4_9MAGN
MDHGHRWGHEIGEEKGRGSEMEMKEGHMVKKGGRVVTGSPAELDLGALRGRWMAALGFLTKEKPQQRVSPSSPTTESTLPLTYFDLPYLLRAPPELLFFYTIPNIEITQFMNSVVPQIKHSLSQTLNHYYPLAGNLIWSQQSNQPIIRCSHGDFVKLTVAQTNADFNHLSGYHSRDPKHLQKLVLHLTDSTSLNMKSDSNGFPVFALRVILFPSFGITLGTSIHHCALRLHLSMVSMI